MISYIAPDITTRRLQRRPLGAGIVVSQHCIVCWQTFTYLFLALVWKTK